NVLPLDDRFVERTDISQRPGFFVGRAEILVYPGMVRIPAGSAPKTANVDHVIRVRIEIPEEGGEGVLVCMGGDWSGWSLFVDDDRLRYHYNRYDMDRYDVVSDAPLPRGHVEIRLQLECDDPMDRGGPATVRLFCNGDQVGEG